MKRVILHCPKGSIGSSKHFPEKSTLPEDDILEVEHENLEVSDGHHTFDELYEHRYALFIALCKYFNERHGCVWRSKLHSDGKMYEGYFLMGIYDERNKGHQISYHLPMALWESTNFAETKDIAPEFDGHTSQDVIERLKSL